MITLSKSMIRLFLWVFSALSGFSLLGCDEAEYGPGYVSNVYGRVNREASTSAIAGIKVRVAATGEYDLTDSTGYYEIFLSGVVVMG